MSSSAASTHVHGVGVLLVLSRPSNGLRMSRHLEPYASYLIVGRVLKEANSRQRQRRPISIWEAEYSVSTIPCNSVGYRIIFQWLMLTYDQGLALRHRDVPFAGYLRVDDRCVPPSETALMRPVYLYRAVRRSSSVLASSFRPSMPRQDDGEYSSWHVSDVLTDTSILKTHRIESNPHPVVRRYRSGRRR